MLKSSSSAGLLRSASQASLVAVGGAAANAVAGAGAQSAGMGLLTGVLSATGAAVSGTALRAARHIYPEFLDPISANMVNEDPEGVVNVHSCIEFDWKPETEGVEPQPVSMSSIKTCWAGFTSNFPRFRERVIVRKWGWPYWEPCELDFDSHFEEVSDPQRTEWTLEDIEEFVSKEFSIGLPLDRPLWKVFLFRRVRKVEIVGDAPGNANDTHSSVAIFKYSHTMADGYHILRVMMSDVLQRIYQEDPDVLQQWVSKDQQKKDASSEGGSSSPSLDIMKVLPAISKVLLLQDDKPSAVKAQKMMTGYCPRAGVWETCPVGVNDLKLAVERENKRLAPQHLTLNDALFGCLSTALTTFAKRKNVPLEDDLTAVIWVALKSLDKLYIPGSIAPIEDMNNDSLGNVYVRLPRTEDSKEASAEVNKRIMSLKGSPEPLLTHQLRGGFGMLPKGVTNLVWPALANKASLSVSSLPGPPFRYEFAGHPVRNVAFWVPPVGSISLFVTMITFCGRISVSLSADKATAAGESLKELSNEICKEVERFCMGATAGTGEGQEPVLRSKL